MACNLLSAPQDQTNRPEIPQYERLGLCVILQDRLRAGTPEAERRMDASFRVSCKIGHRPNCGALLNYFYSD